MSVKSARGLQRLIGTPTLAVKFIASNSIKFIIRRHTKCATSITLFLSLYLIAFSAPTLPSRVMGICLSRTPPASSQFCGLVQGNARQDLTMSVVRCVSSVRKQNFVLRSYIPNIKT
jgi:hypothetical protein